MNGSISSESEGNGRQTPGRHLPDGNGSRVAAPTLGISQSFQPGDHDAVEQILGDLRAYNLPFLRAEIICDAHSGADLESWYAWLMPTLAAEVAVMPSFFHPPASPLLPANADSTPPEARAQCVERFLSRFGRYVEAVELWSEPNRPAVLEPQASAVFRGIAAAARTARKHGLRTILGGIDPFDCSWLRWLLQSGVTHQIDAIGLKVFPDRTPFTWPGWEHALAGVREVLRRFGARERIWITETGYSSAGYAEFAQLEAFLDLSEARVERAYWHCARDGAADDPDPALPQRALHGGLRHADGRDKMLARLWSRHGINAVRSVRRMSTTAPRQRTGERYVLITGGCGFIGCNVADRLLRMGPHVVVLDSLSRPGVEENLRWLHANHGSRVDVIPADIRDARSVRKAVRGAEHVFHFTAQVAVTTSLDDPIEDFDVNGRGTVCLLDMLRRMNQPPSILFTSTNKVYGGLEDLPLRAGDTRYEPIDPHIHRHGIAEDRPLDFHSPYGCSKGCADQYVLDFARTSGVSGVVFRMSCIYGPRQFGTEDQGWVAHFLIRAMRDEPITLYGDGKQVRDLLFIDDVVDAMLLAQARIRRLSGQAFNIGGGPQRTISLLELIRIIGEITGRQPAVGFSDWRTADQRYYVSDTSRFRNATGWAPSVGVREGVERLYTWLTELHGRPRTAERQTLSVVTT